MRIMVPRRVAICLLLVGCEVGWATDYHVATWPHAADVNPGTVDAPWATLTKAANTLRAGDTVYIHGGTYRERVWPQYGGTATEPITYQAFGDGDVIVDGTGVVFPYSAPEWGLFMVACPSHSGHSKLADVNYIRIRGLPPAENGPATWIDFCNSRGSGIAMLADDQLSTSRGMMLEYVRCYNNSVGIWLSGQDAQVLNCECYRNRQAGLWLFGPSPGKPESRAVIRGGRYYLNQAVSQGSYRNTDGITVQDATGVLIEDLEVYGNYDGLDIGSQGRAPGCAFVIVRRVRAHDNTNGNLPSSTTGTGPILYAYNQQWGNADWGSSVAYESSTNVHWWNNTFAKVKRAIYVQAPKTPPVFVVRNSIIDLQAESLPNLHHALLGDSIPIYDGATYRITGVEAPSGSGVLIDNNRISSGTTVPFAGGCTPGAANSVGSITFLDRADNDYRIDAAANPACVDQGAFFTEVKAGVDESQTIETTADPRIYFRVGDRVQIQGVGEATVVALDAGSITLDRAVSARAGSGVHYPYQGAAPDLGALEGG